MIVVDVRAADAAEARLGRYKVTERREDGSLLLVPESVEEVIEQTAERPMSEEEFLDALERLDVAAAQRPPR